jgi:ribonuclease P protein component
MKRTFQPSVVRRKRTHGFRVRMRTRDRAGGDSRPARQGSHPSRRLSANRLGRRQRLGGADVAAVLKNGVLTRGTRLHLYRLPNSVAYPRLALIVPKRLVASAVARNRVRRVMREAFRIRQSCLGRSDCILRVVKAGEPAISRAEIESLLLACNA